MPASHYDLLSRHRTPPTGIQVWIASYNAELPGFTGYAAVEVTGQGEEDPADRNAFIRTFTFGPLAFQTFGTTSPALLNLSVHWPEPTVHQLWPYAGSFTWTRVR